MNHIKMQHQKGFEMKDYQGPERRTTVTFTREDSDRLVRIEEAVKIVPNVVERIEKLEAKQNWIAGLGAAIVFIISAVIGIFHKSI